MRSAVKIQRTYNNIKIALDGHYIGSDITMDVTYYMNKSCATQDTGSDITLIRPMFLRHCYITFIKLRHWK